MSHGSRPCSCCCACIRVERDAALSWTPGSASWTSRPALFYYDVDGQPHTIEGSEIFALDPCYSVGVGCECTWYRRTLGGVLEARVVNTPGRTEPAHTIATLRAGIQITIPKWLGSR